MRRILIWTFVLIIWHAAPSYGGSALEGRLASMLPTNARWAISVVDMESGKEIMRGGSTGGDSLYPSSAPGRAGVDEGLVPGSLVKLFTAGAVYDYMEKHGNIDMTTKVGYYALKFGYILTGDIHIRGRGNALLTGAALTSAAKSFKRDGVTKLEGNIILDDTLLSGNGIERTRSGSAYTHPSAFGVDLHTVAVFVTPTKPGKAPKVSVEPFNEKVRFAVSARTVKGKKNTLEVTRIDDTSYKIEGDLPEGAGEMKERFLLEDPALYAAWAFKGALEKEGVRIEGTVKRGTYPQKADGEITLAAPAMDDIVRDMNVNSINVVADNLFLLVGAGKYGAPGTREKGIKAVRDLLGRLGLPETAAIADGSGLSGKNRVSASFMARYLYEVSKTTWSAKFRASLPQAGEGTLRDIEFDDTRFRAKTGVLEEVFALAGYGVDRNGKPVSFAYILNVPGASKMGSARTGAQVMRSISTEVIQ